MVKTMKRQILPCHRFWQGMLLKASYLKRGLGCIGQNRQDQSWRGFLPCQKDVFNMSLKTLEKFRKNLFGLKCNKILLQTFKKIFLHTNS